MTLDEFNQIDRWCELKDFAYDVGYDGLDEIVDDEELNEWLNDKVNYWWDDGWEYLRDRLNDVPCSETGWYTIDYYNDVSADPDICDYMDDFREWCLENEVFDNPETDDLDTYVRLDEEIPEEQFEMEFSIDELFSSSRESTQKLFIEIVETTQEDDDEAEALLQMLSLSTSGTITVSGSTTSQLSTVEGGE